MDEQCRDLVMKSAVRDIGFLGCITYYGKKWMLPGAE